MLHPATLCLTPFSLLASDTTPDGLFTLREVECLGACANAPMIQLNDDFYVSVNMILSLELVGWRVDSPRYCSMKECLTPDTMVQLLEACKKDDPPKMAKWGSLPMNGQLSCEGPLGKTSLLWEKPPGPGFKVRPDSELQSKVWRVVPNRMAATLSHTVTYGC